MIEVFAIKNKKNWKIKMNKKSQYENETIDFYKQKI